MSFRVAPILDQFLVNLSKPSISASFTQGYLVESQTGTASFTGVLIYKGTERLDQDKPGYTGKGIAHLYVDKSLNVNIVIGDRIIDPNNGQWRVQEVITYSDVADVKKFVLVREEP